MSLLFNTLSSFVIALQHVWDAKKKKKDHSLILIWMRWAYSRGKTYTCILTWRRNWQPTPVFSPGESHGQRSLMVYTPWGHKELDTAEQLTHTHILTNNRLWDKSGYWHRISSLEETASVWPAERTPSRWWDLFSRAGERGEARSPWGITFSQDGDSWCSPQSMCSWHHTSHNSFFLSNLIAK